MKYNWVYGVAALAFFLLGYLSSTKGDFSSAGVYVVLGVVFVVLGADKSKK